MNPHEGSGQHYLVEWYDPALTAAPLAGTAEVLQAGAVAASVEAGAVRLELTLAAPADEVLYGVFLADRAEAVLRACQLAGWAPDRLTTGVRTHLATSLDE